MIKKLFFLFFILIPSVSYSRDFEIGMCVHVDKYELSSEKIVTYLKRYNITSVRIDYPWRLVEKTRGIYQPASEKLDNFIALAEKNNINVLIILDYGNVLYGGGKPYTEEQVKAFSDYAAWVTIHFKKYHPTYEIWNEWSVQKYHSDELLVKSAIAYLNLVKKSSKRIKEEDAESNVIAGSFITSFSWDWAWAKYLSNHGLLDYVDGVSLHPYNYAMKSIPSAEQSINDITTFKKSVFGEKHVDLFITEYGFPHDKNSVKNISNLSNYMNDYMHFASKTKYIKGVWFYELIDEVYDKPNPNFGLLTSHLLAK
ncbi:hypothetical protein L2I46_26225 [Klebsiella sp. 2019SCSN059]|nr:hypothetical protein [Klebsiella sp. 2019SCSN059]